jgi:hypothetical protein
VTLADSLAKAQSLMMRHDYSQLAVMSGPRKLRGAITWESIAQAKIRNPSAELPEAVVSCQLVKDRDDLLEQIPRIIDAGYVFVEAIDASIGGIVTTSDLSNQFAVLANPFFVLSEIEGRLRRIIDRTFSDEELQAACDPAGGAREVRSAHDLTFGEYVHLLESPERWDRLGWALDRTVFVDALHKVRRTRNEVMHFSPDPLDQAQMTEMENFVKWLRRLDPD